VKKYCVIVNNVVKKPKWIHYLRRREACAKDGKVTGCREPSCHSRHRRTTKRLCTSSAQRSKAAELSLALRWNLHDCSGTILVTLASTDHRCPTSGSLVNVGQFSLNVTAAGPPCPSQVRGSSRSDFELRRK